MNSEFGGGTTSVERGWNLRWQTLELRRYDQRSGYVWTELYDIEHETAGIYSFERALKDTGANPPAMTNAASTVVPAMLTVTRASRACGPAAVTVAVIASSAGAAASATPARYVAGRASSQTGCQMPLLGVKAQMSYTSRGMLRCLPCTISRLSTGAETRTTTVASAPAAPPPAPSASVMSNSKGPPDAVFCYNDLLALGAVRTLLSRGLRVPEDVAVVGFDNIESGRYNTPSLTTISPDKSTIAWLAVDRLVSRIGERADGEPAELWAPYELVVRESTGG